MAMSGNTLVDIYGRQSMHSDRSIGEQLDIGRARADSEGWTIHAVYSDGVSASRHAAKARDDWPRLLADVEKGRTNVVWLWESSRGDRRASSWLVFLESCQARGIRIYVETHNRLYDMDNPRDWRTLAEDGTDNQYESEKIRQRVLRASAAGAQRGKPAGTVAFGYRRRYDPTSARRRLLAQEPEPTEAPIVREIFNRLRKGHSLKAIARDFDRRGVRTRSGRAWTPEHLRSTARRPTYAGLRSHNGTLYEGQWEGLVDRATWYQVQRRLSDPARVTTRPGRARHLLSMIGRCDVCGAPLAATMRNASRWKVARFYQCHHKGCVRVDADELDALAEKIMLAYLARKDVYEELSRSDEATGERLTQIRGELAELRSRLDALADDLDIDEATLARRSKALKTKITLLETEERELSTPPALKGLLSPGKDVRRRWKAAPMSTRREVARMLLAPDMLGQLRVARRPRDAGPVHVPVAERVVWRRD